ncbi:MAG: AcvB/VirJ family lysyl-phosphatidylglycerol hydrolase, partial [Terriglobia bacterium]
MLRRVIVCGLLSLLAVGPACLGQEFTPVKNTWMIRGQKQDIYFIPGSPPMHSPHPKILFAPGDGGWRGFALTIAETMASWGYDVYALDTKRYLESFSGKTGLTVTDVPEDFSLIADLMV